MGRQLPSSRSQWQNHGNETLLSLFCLPVPSGYLPTPHWSERCAGRAALQGPGAISNVLVAALGTASSGSDPQGGTSSSSRGLLLAQASSHQLSPSQQTIISSMVVPFSRSRHSSEVMCANRRIMSHLHVYVGSFQPSFPQQRSPRVWAKEPQCPQQSLGVGIQQDGLQCPQDSWPLPQLAHPDTLLFNTD